MEVERKTQRRMWHRVSRDRVKNKSHFNGLQHTQHCSHASVSPGSLIIAIGALSSRFKKNKNQKTKLNYSRVLEVSQR